MNVSRLVAGDVHLEIIYISLHGTVQNSKVCDFFSSSLRFLKSSYWFDTQTLMDEHITYMPTCTVPFDLLINKHKSGKINSDLPNSSSNCQNLCFFRRKSVSFQIFNIRVALKIRKFNVWQVPNVYNLWRYVEHPSIKINQKFNKFSEFSVYWNKFLHIFCTVVKWENLSVNTWIIFFSWACCFHS